MGKAFWTQTYVSNLSKEKESQTVIVAEKKRLQLGFVKDSVMLWLFMRSDHLWCQYNH